MIFISVIIPLYNKEKSIRQTVFSVLEQSHSNFELIIIDDGSTDDSLSMVKQIEDNRIRVISKPNEGVSSARNCGIRSAKYDYLAFLDGDDLWSKAHLSTLVEMIGQKDTADVGGFATSFYKSTVSKFEEKLVNTCEKPFLVLDYFDFMSTPENRFNSSTLLVKKTKIAEVGFFNTDLKYGEDVELWYRLFKKYSLVFNPIVTALYFVAAENRSSYYVMPLNNRFHTFNFKEASKSEKRYLGKLVALLLIDYCNQSAVKIALKLLWKYKLYANFFIKYIILLISKKLTLPLKK